MRDAPGTPAAAPVLRVAAYNIHRAVGRDRRRDPARIAAVIGELDADLIGLQEVDWHHEPDAARSQFEYLAHLPGYRAVDGPNLRDHRGHYGNLLLTRVPLGRVARLDLSEPGREPRGAIDVDIADRRLGLRVIVTHLGLGFRERWRQSVRLRELLEARPEQPTLLIGDFNDWLPGSPTLRPLLRLCRATARPGSFPSFLPLFALDRILARPSPAHPGAPIGIPSGIPSGIRRHGTALARSASDHLPIVSEIHPATATPHDGGREQASR